MTDFLTLRTSLRPVLKAGIIKRALLFAFMGIALLLGFGLFTPYSFLSSAGVIVILLSLFLVAFGYMPYKRVTRLETFPNKIFLQDNTLSYIKYQKECLQLRRDEIVKVDFVEAGAIYGIALVVEKSARERLPPASFMSRLCLKNVKKKCDYDVFFPYFSMRSEKSLQEWLRHFD